MMDLMRIIGERGGGGMANMMSDPAGRERVLSCLGDGGGLANMMRIKAQAV